MHVKNVLRVELCELKGCELNQAYLSLPVKQLLAPVLQELDAGQSDTNSKVRGLNHRHFPDRTIFFGSFKNSNMQFLSSTFDCTECRVSLNQILGRYRKG